MPSFLSLNSLSTSCADIGSANRKPCTDEQPCERSSDQLRGFLDALGGRLHAERMGEFGDRADDRAGAVAGQQVLDEAAVDLDLVEREALQIAQRRIAGAEIVERDADAERAQRVEQLQGRVAAFEEDRFGDLDLEPRWREARWPPARRRIVSCSAPRWNCTVETLTATRICSGQCAACAQASRIDPGADRHDQAGLLGDRDELDRRDEAAGRVVPADQRLERADPVVLEVEQRLVKKLELAALDREPQVGLELPPLLRALVEALLEEGEGPAAGFLGAVEREVGIPAAGSRRPRRPPARSRCRCWSKAGSSLPSMHERPAHFAQDVAGKPVDRVAVVADSLQDDELVAAEPRDEMAARGLARRAAPASTSKRVAGGMAERVVDDLELVEVEAVKREQAATASAARNRCSSCCWNIVRLGRPVSTSLKASWVIRCSRSAILPTISLKLFGEPRELVGAAHRGPAHARRTQGARRRRRAARAAG